MNKCGQTLPLTKYEKSLMKTSFGPGKIRGVVPAAIRCHIKINKKGVTITRNCPSIF